MSKEGFETVTAVSVNNWQTRLVVWAKKLPTQTTALVLALIFGVILLGFSMASFISLAVGAAWFPPGYYAFLLTLIGGIGALAHIVGLALLLFAQKAAMIDPKAKRAFYAVTMLYVLIFAVNMIVAWMFYDPWCTTFSPQQNSLTGIFNCIAPVFLDENGNAVDVQLQEQYLLYKNVHLVSALFAPILAFSIFYLLTALWNVVVSEVYTPTPTESKVSYLGYFRSTAWKSAISIPFFLGGIIFYLSIVIFAGLAFFEALSTFDYMAPFAFTVTFTFLVGALALVAGGLLVYYIIENRTTPRKNADANPERMTAMESALTMRWVEGPARAVLPIYVFFVVVYVGITVLLWEFYHTACFDADGVALEECKHPLRPSQITVDPIPENTFEIYFAFETLSTAIGFLWPFLLALVVKHALAFADRSAVYVTKDVKTAKDSFESIEKAATEEKQNT